MVFDGKEETLLHHRTIRNVPSDRKLNKSSQTTDDKNWISKTAKRIKRQFWDLFGETTTETPTTTEEVQEQQQENVDEVLFAFYFYFQNDEIVIILGG